MCPATPLAPQYTHPAPVAGQVIVKQGIAELAIVETSIATWVGHVDSSYKPHGVGVLFLRERGPDGKRTKLVQTREHGKASSIPWNQICSAPEGDDDDLDCDLLPYGYYETEPINQ